MLEPCLLSFSLFLSLRCYAASDDGECDGVWQWMATNATGRLDSGFCISMVVMGFNGFFGGFFR